MRIFQGNFRLEANLKSTIVCSILKVIFEVQNLKSDYCAQTLELKKRSERETTMRKKTRKLFLNFKLRPFHVNSQPELRL